MEDQRKRRQSKSGSRTTPAFRRRPLPKALMQCFILAALGPQFTTNTMAGAPTPGARIPLTALPSGPAGQPQVGTIGGRAVLAPQVVSGSFAPYAVTDNRNGTVSATVSQSSNAGILQWQSFDIGANATVNVVQPSSAAVLLNKVASGDFNQSTVIEGKLNANGQVYVYNPNGIIFGKSSQINVNALVATTLKIDDNRFLAGLLAPTNPPLPIFAADPAFKPDGVTLGPPGSISVEGDSTSTQARITTATGGRILLVAPTVTNNGVLSAPDGQVILAAGGKVFVASPGDVTMRGLVVEVSNDNLAGAATATAYATNDASGRILVGRGNATMVGLAVNQKGLVSATTSVVANGSIYLHARDGATISADTPLTSKHGGALLLGAGSVTEVLPDLGDSTTSSGAGFNPSLVDLAGSTVHLQQDAAVLAPNGKVNVSAFALAQQGATVSPGGNSHIYLDSGARIDVSGSTGAQLAMESNVMQVQLRGSELADSPLQRNSIVRGKTVSIDIRKGTPLADVSGWLNLVEHGIAEQTAPGGTINLQSDSDIVVNRGAALNVSGGMVSYLPGYIATTKLTSNGQVVDIGSATADRIYDGIIDPVAGPRNFAAGYVQGYSAGTITLNAPSVVLRGDLAGGVTTGPYQRQAGAANVPLGGQLILGYSDTKGDLAKLHFAGSAFLNGEATAAVPVPVFNDANPTNALTLPATLRTSTDVAASAISANGFSRLKLYADEGDIKIGGALSMSPGGELTVSAPGGALEIAGNISLPGGKLTASAPAVRVNSGVSLDVAGRWTNDLAGTSPAMDAQGNPVTPIVLSGGSISLVAPSGSGLAQVSIGDNVSLDASGGAWINGQGKQTAGSGGTITLGPSVGGTNLPGFQALSTGQHLILQGYGVASGGSLNVSAPNVLIGATSADPSILGLSSAWFQQGGFSSYNISAGGNLTVAGGAMITPGGDNWIASRSTPGIASGRMRDAFSTARLPVNLAGSRKATSLSLRAAKEDASGQGVLEVGQNAVVTTDPGGTLTLSAGSLLDVEGTLSAPGGKINLFLSPDGGTSSLPERSIWLGASAVLDASGSASQLWTDSRGVTQGNLLDGGQIAIGRINSSGQFDAAQGYFLARGGATMNVSGTRSPMTLGSGRSGASSSLIASNGGAVVIRASEGLLVDGTFAASGGDDSARGGSLSLTLDRENLSASPYATADLVLARQSPSGGSIPAGLAPGAAISGLQGHGFVAADGLNAGGFDTLRLKSAGTISFDLAAGNFTLGAKSGVQLDAPTFSSRNAGVGSTVSITAPYVALGNSDWRYQSASATESTGPASLLVRADTVDLIGHSTLRGFSAATMAAAGDIRLVGQVGVDLTQTVASVPDPIRATGGFTLAGTMRLESAQVYPTSLSEFTLAATGAAGAITFAGNGNPHELPLSAAGTLVARAQGITQSGVVRAPLGTLDFEAGNSLSYGADSLTSVAGSKSVPLGMVQNGRDWLYDFGNGHMVNLSDSTASNYVALPEKSLISRGATVSVDRKATLDLAGGGDLYAYEFSPGPGGSKDILASANTFAILPGFASPVAPSDFQYGQGGFDAGSKIYLSGMDGLAAGFYTLLPAHYALLPGAYAVSGLANSRNMSAAQNFRTTLGTWQVAGYRSSAGNGRDGQWQGFTLTPAALVRQQSEFADYSADSFLAASAVSLPGDSGHVVFDVGQSLALKGTVRLSGGSDGQRGIADISAQALAVVADANQLLPIEADANAVKIAAADLNALGADSLLLGGVRTHKGKDQVITVGAGQVIVANDAQHPLTGAELLLVAGSQESLVADPLPGNPTHRKVSAAAGVAGQGLVLLKENSSIAATGTPTHRTLAFTLENKSNPDGLGADGAMLRVSNGAPVDWNRNFIAGNGSVIGPAGVAGTLKIESGAVVSSAGALAFDSTASTTTGTVPVVDAGVAVQYGAKHISLGTSAPTSVDGLRFDDAALAAFSSLKSLSLSSYSTLDVYGVVNLGKTVTDPVTHQPTNTMKTLSLTASGIQACGDRCDAGSDERLRQATFTADTVRLSGSGVHAAATTVPKTGANYAQSSFAIEANDIEIGSNTLAFSGYANGNLNARDHVRAAGMAADLSSDANLAIKAGRIVGGSGADATFRAAGLLDLKQFGATPTDSLAAQFGGRLAFVGDRITSSATIQATAGLIEMTATGTDGVAVTGGELNAAGASQNFGATAAGYAPGGTIRLTGGLGNVSIDSGATIDVSAIGAAAGTLSVKASKSIASLNGSFKGDSGAGQVKGQFELDVGSLGGADQFTQLNDKLNSAGFTASRSVRVRSGNIVVANALDDHGAQRDAIRAQSVLLEADAGSLTIAGRINADGEKGGSIELYAAEATAGQGKGVVTVSDTATLSAKATVAATSTAGSTGAGGRIVIGTATTDGSQPNRNSGDANIAIQAGASLDVSGSGLGRGGTVVLRAPRLASNADVAIADFDAAAIHGARSVAVEAFKVYTAQKISSDADSATNLMVADTSGAAAGTMYNEANAFATHGGTIVSRFANSGALALMPGLEVRSSGDLSVSVNESDATSPSDRGWDLNTWRFNGQPGMLTLRAAGNLNVNGSISDGFVKKTGAAMPDWTIDPSTSDSSSWSYRLAGGSDLTAARPLATSPSGSAGNVTLSFGRLAGTATDNPTALIRTGTGSIDVTAGGGILLDTLDLTKGQLVNGNFGIINFSATGDTLLGASIYTSGRKANGTPASPPTNASNSWFGSTASANANFMVGGGSISLYAEGDITGTVTQQMVNNWLFRQGQVTTDSAGNTVFAKAFSGGRTNPYNGPVQYTAWWSRPDYFDEGIATFGGGDISVRSGAGNIVDLSASVATNGFFTPTTGLMTTGASRTEYGGGNLSVTAAGDIRGGVFYVQKGSASLLARGAITTGNRMVTNALSGVVAPIALRPVLAAGDAQFAVIAGKDLNIEAAINPTLVIQSSKNVPAVLDPTKSASLFTNFTDQLSYFSTYSATSAVNLTSISGGVQLNENLSAIVGAGGPSLAWNQGSSMPRLTLLHPGTLTATALKGDINIREGFSLWPSPNGQLQLLAGGSVGANPALSSGFTQPIVMVDRDPSVLLPMAAPRIPNSTDFYTIQAALQATGIYYHSPAGLHQADPTPVRIAALEGDVTFKANNGNATTLVLSKSAEILAGRDIVDVGFSIQNMSTTDVTSVRAGRDIIDTTIPAHDNGVSHVVTGPGRIDFTAGRNFDLGNSKGVETRGNLDNPYLPASGAAINVVAGATPDYQNFAAQYPSPSTFTDAEGAALLSYMRRIEPALPANTSLSDAWARFNSYSLNVRRPFLDTLFVDALQVTSGAVGGSALDLEKYDAAIASLFPVSSIGGGDVNLFGSQLKTSRGGAINIYAPGGSVYAGLVSVPGYLKNKSAADLGVFTIGGGAISALVKNNFLVNQGRVFTLGGGDITLASQYGDIDAGKGAKTAQAAPAPVLRTDNKGNTTVDISGSISGSGIATLQTNADIPASNVYPIAPRGIFDAGDAGVRSSGSVSIVAATVLNANNIAASGSVSGAKTVDTGGLGGAVAAPASSPVAKADSFANAAAPDPNAATSLTVELLGYGTGGIQQNVTQGDQNRQRAGDAADEQKKQAQ